MPNRTVGKDVDAYCAKCKLVLAHTIEAMVGDRITRVHCNTCKAQHAYRAGPPGSSTRRPGAKRTTSAAVPDYAKLIRGRDPAKARRYAASERFATSDLLDHPTFGLGVVIGLKEVNKIEVVFEGGSKVLVHSR